MSSFSQCGRINSSKPHTYKIYGKINNKLNTIPEYPTGGVFSTTINLFNDKTTVGVISGTLVKGESTTATSLTEVYDLDHPENSVIYRKDGGTTYTYSLTNATYTPSDVSSDVLLFQAVYANYGNSLTIQSSD